MLSCGFVYAAERESRENISTAPVVSFNDLLDILDSRSTAPISGALEGELVDIQQTRTTVSADDATGLKAIILGLIGNYETVTTDYTYQSSNGYYSHSITTERDWAWICSLALFVVVIWCVFRGVVAILCRK